MVGLKVRDVGGPSVAAPYIGGISPIGILNVNQGLLRTDFLRKVGSFSETFGFYGIDPGLTAMVLYSGHDVVYTKKSRCTTTAPGSPTKAIPLTQRRNASSSGGLSSIGAGTPGLALTIEIGVGRNGHGACSTSGLPSCAIPPQPLLGRTLP